MSKITYCNICGKKFDIFDKDLEAELSMEMGYGSKYDGEFVSIDICNECMDKLIDACKISPIESDSIL